MKNYTKQKKTQSIGEFVAAFRSSRGYSRRSLARIIDVSAALIARAENDDFPLAVDLMRKIYKICTTEERKVLLEVLYNAIEEQMELEPIKERPPLSQPKRQGARSLQR